MQHLKNFQHSVGGIGRLVVKANRIFSMISMHSCEHIVKKALTLDQPAHCRVLVL